jgi:pimeloyl-[acyl-carrier protein] synthase
MAVGSEPSFNPFDPRLADAPYSIYREQRERSPVTYEESLGAYFVWGYEEVREVLRHSQGDLRYVDFQRTRLPEGITPEDQPYCQAVRDLVLMKAGADHKRVRATFARHFTPRRVQALHERIAAKAHELLDGFKANGQTELMESFARPLPLFTIGSLLDVSEADTARIAEHVHYFELAIQFVPLNAEQLAHVNAGFGGLRDIFSEIIADRRAHLGDDLLSMLIAEADAGALTDGELIAAGWGLYATGHDTTAQFLCSAIVTLLEHPDQLALLQQEPDRIPGAVDELLRFRGFAPVTHRIFPEPLELAGRTIPANTPILVYLAAGNHDPRWCPHAEELDLSVESSPDHLTFGDGPHKCVGRHLARLMLTVELETLLTGLCGLRLNGKVEWNHDNFPIIAPRRLPLAWDAAG